MRKLIVAEHISLDGVVQSPGAPQEDAGGVMLQRYVRGGEVRTGTFGE